VRHRELAVEGVQFHPEAILTEHGHALLKNFLDRVPENTDADSSRHVHFRTGALQRTIEQPRDLPRRGCCRSCVAS